MRLVLTLVFLSFFSLFAYAAEPPKEPILTIETGGHTAPIGNLATDTSGHWLVSASGDKTVRVWEVAEKKENDFLRLVRVIRPPSGEANDGVLLGVSLSPDGATIAAGGNTGWYWDGSTSIYIFNRASGNMIKKITGLPHVILSLAFSPDGQYLVATLWGKHGIRVYRTKDWTLAGEDKNYDDSTECSHFSRDGHLVTTSRDGYLRLYDIEDRFRLIAKVKGYNNEPPDFARFSPDGKKIVVRSIYSTTVTTTPPLAGRIL